MTDAKKPDRGQLRVDEEECKGCGLCIEACPPKVISLSERLNHYGYRTAFYRGNGCTACGICFMVCPEPGAITVLRLVIGVSHPFRDEAAGKDGATAVQADSHFFRDKAAEKDGATGAAGGAAA
jgi:NAD-dependent dihydropyrimidine dehydrogenase PreA subunit